MDSCALASTRAWKLTVGELIESLSLFKIFKTTWSNLSLHLSLEERESKVSGQRWILRAYRCWALSWFPMDLDHDPSAGNTGLRNYLITEWVILLSLLERHNNRLMMSTFTLVNREDDSFPQN